MALMSYLQQCMQPVAWTFVSQCSLHQCTFPTHSRCRNTRNEHKSSFRGAPIGFTTYVPSASRSCTTLVARVELFCRKHRSSIGPLGFGLATVASDWHELLSDKPCDVEQTDLLMLGAAGGLPLRKDGSERQPIPEVREIHQPPDFLLCKWSFIPFSQR